MTKGQRQKRFKTLFFDEKGMTLIEAMGGLVILALTLVLIYSGFLTAQKIIDHGDALEEQSQDAYASIEKDTASSGDTENIAVTLGSKTLNFSGQYSEINEEGTDTGLYSFKSSCAQNTNVADEVRNTFISWINTFNSMDWWWRSYYGYPLNVTNSDCRTWVRNNVYGGVWPTMDENFLERNAITLSPFYVQPYCYAPAYALTDDVFVYATDTTGDNNWHHVRYIYDHEQHVWYCYKWWNGYNINHQSWSTVKSEIHTDSWYALN